MITELPNQRVARQVNGDILPSDVLVVPSVSTLQFKMFTILWAIASLFHMAHSSVFDKELNLALLTLAAFFAIFRPSLRSFLVLITFQVCDAVFRMPFTTNHWIFTALANLTIFHVILFMIFKRKGFGINEGDLFRSFAPLLRIEVITLYFFAVFHKMNSGFFTPEGSCATYLLRAQNVDSVIPLTSGLLMFNAYFTLAVELSIPLMLCFSRTRNFGVLLGIIFHSVLSYSTHNAFYDFSSLMFAAYFVFLDPSFTVTIQQSFKQLKSAVAGFFQRYSFGRVICTIVFVLVAVGTVYALNKQLNSSKTVHLYFFWSLYSAMFLMCVVLYMLKKNQVTVAHDQALRISHWSLMVMPLVVLLNGTSPYLGLKTENSYAMFSNLRTEGGQTNHFIVPASAQIFDYQKDVVQILSTTDQPLQKLAKENKAMVLFEFRNYVHNQKPERVEYLLNGERRVVMSSDKASMEALGKNPYILRKLMKFRPFVPDGPQPCSH